MGGKTLSLGVVTMNVVVEVVMTSLVMMLPVIPMLPRMLKVILVAGTNGEGAGTDGDGTKVSDSARVDNDVVVPIKIGWDPVINK